jgi:DNA-binding transcriptional ArsR family regulator
MNIQRRIDPEAMRAAAEEATALLKALSNRHRLLILCQLSQGERSVGQLAGVLGIRDSTASQHLALLRRDRIIAGRRDAQTVWYRIASAAALEVVQALYAAYCADRAPRRKRDDRPLRRRNSPIAVKGESR